MSSAGKSKSSTASPGGSTASPWVICSICDRMIPRSASARHAEDNCKITYPFIQNKIAHVTITEVPSTSKIMELPFIESRHSRSMLFLSKEIIAACGFASFSWVILSAMEGDGDDDMKSRNFVPLAFRVWPIPPTTDIGKNCSGAFATAAAFYSSNISQNRSFTLKAMPPPSNPFKPFPPLGQAILRVVCPDLPEIIIPEHEMDKLVQNFKKIFANRVATRGNVFRYPFYTMIVEIQILVQTNIEETFDLRNFETLSMLELTLSNKNLQFYEITSTTVFSFEHVRQPSPHGSGRQITLDNVGGLDSVRDEVIFTMKYVFENSKSSSRSSLSAGILLHGHHGTGKSLLVQAICSSLNLNTVWYQEFSSKCNLEGRYGLSVVKSSIAEAFADAVRNSPSAVVIENLDLVGTKVSRSETNSSFISQLRTQIEKINSMEVEVIVLATCTDLEAVDSALRAPHIFGKEIEIPVPAVTQREDILTKLLKSFNHNLTSEDIKQVASITHGFVGADLSSLIAQSHLQAQRSNPKESYGINIKDVEDCMKIVHPSAMKSILIDVPNVKWDDIGGQHDIKFKLKQAIEWPLKHPEAFMRLGITPPKGVLMYGPPGCSKTMIAKAIATESGLNFISVKGSELFSKWVGESEKAVRSLFRKARQVSPCIIFFDEIDSLGGERGSSSGGSSNVHERVLAQLLIEIDGIEALKDVTIVAATNRPDIIDPALLRPGRLDRIIHVPLPDAETRQEILNIHFRKMPIASDVDVQKLVQRTERYSGAELAAVCHEAALKALEENIEAVVVQESHLLNALSLITPRTSSAQIKFYEKFSQSRSKTNANANSD